MGCYDRSIASLKSRAVFISYSRKDEVVAEFISACNVAVQKIMNKLLFSLGIQGQLTIKGLPSAREISDPMQSTTAGKVNFNDALEQTRMY